MSAELSYPGCPAPYKTTVDGRYMAKELESPYPDEGYYLALLARTRHKLVDSVKSAFYLD